MQERGSYVLKVFTKEHIRRKLEAEFSDALNIFQDSTGKLLALPDILSKYELAKENIRLTKELDTLHNQSSDVSYVLHFIFDQQ